MGPARDEPEQARIAHVSPELVEMPQWGRRGMSRNSRIPFVNAQHVSEPQWGRLGMSRNRCQGAGSGPCLVASMGPARDEPEQPAHPPFTVEVAQPQWSRLGTSRNRARSQLDTGGRQWRLNGAGSGRAGTGQSDPGYLVTGMASMEPARDEPEQGSCCGALTVAPPGLN